MSTASGPPSAKRRSGPSLGPGSWTVASGSGGRHVYVALADCLPAVEVERLNRRLAVALDADAKWSGESLLRVPGTRNHKGRARGGSAVWVRQCEVLA